MEDETIEEEVSSGMVIAPEEPRMYDNTALLLMITEAAYWRELKEE